MNRNIGICIVLTIVTCGIYGIYWMVKITDEMNALYPDDYRTSGGMACVLSIVTCNLYGIYWAYKMGRKGRNDNSLIYLLLEFFGLSIVNYALIQDIINNTKPIDDEMNIYY